MKKLLAIIIATLLLFVTACGQNESVEKTAEKDEVSTENAEKSQIGSVEVEEVKVAMMIWDNGPQQQATQNYCKVLEEGIEGLSFVYGQLDSDDENANVSACQAMISQGVDGIILYNQTLGLPTIAEICKEAGAYVATYLSDPPPDMKEQLVDNEYYLGGVMDGYVDTSVVGEYAANIAISNGYKHIGSVTFPLDIMPPMKTMLDAFHSTVEEYNSTSSDDEKIELYENEEVFFTQVDASYFANHPEIDAVFGAAGGVLSVYPTLVSTGLAGDVKLISTGMLYDDDTITAIENGNIVLASTSSIEQLIYPLALIHNAVHGLDYADNSEGFEIASCGMMFIETSEDIQTMKEKSYLYASEYDEVDRLMITPKEAKQYMLAFNPDSTYQDLTEVLLTLNMETLAEK